MSKELVTPQWLPLLNYSTKYGISLSTLRRRIKSDSIQFKLESGKYFILEEASKEAGPQKQSSHQEIQALPKSAPLKANMLAPSHHENVSLSSSSFVEASVLSSANRLVEEIKSAYAKILQEKEEQIAQFKEEVADLRMLVRILEEGPVNKKSPTKTPESIETYPPAEASKEIFSNDAFSGEDVFFGDFQNRDI